METSRFVFFGEPLCLILGTPQAQLERSSTASLSIAGAESNVAIALARLGHHCRFHSAVGGDPYGERVLRTLRSENIDTESVLVVPGEVTGLISRNCYAWREPDVFYHRNHSAFLAHSEAAADRVNFAPGDIFFTTGITLALGDGCRRATIRLIKKARKSGVPVCLDVNYRQKLWSEAAFRQTLRPLLPDIRTLFLGREEGKVLTQLSKPETMARQLLKEGVQEVIIKDGARGAWHFGAKIPPLHGKPFSLVHVVDPIGAGDAFNAGFLAATISGKIARNVYKLAMPWALWLASTTGTGNPFLLSNTCSSI